MIFKKTLFKKNILALIAISRLTTSLSLTLAQLLQTVLLSSVTSTKITYNGAPLGLSSQAGGRIVLLITEK